MLRSRAVQIGVVLVVVGALLSVFAVVAGWPDWLVVVLFVAAAVTAQVLWPGKRRDE